MFKNVLNKHLAPHEASTEALEGLDIPSFAKGFDGKLNVS